MARMLSPARSLSVKLILFFLAGSVVPMIFLTVITTATSRTNMLQITRQRIKSLVDDSVSRIESFLSERKSDAEVLAALPIIRDTMLSNGSSDAITGTINSDDSTTFLKKFRDAYGYSTVSLVNTRGDVLVSTKDDLVGTNLADEKEIQEGLDGRTTISEVRVEENIGQARLYFYVSTPVYDDQDTIIGAVHISSPLDKLDAIVGSDTGQSGTGSYSVLMDEYLIRISNPANPEHILNPTVSLSEEERQKIIAEGRLGSQTMSMLNRATDLQSVREAADKLLMGQNAVFFSGRTGSTGESSEAMIHHIDEVNWFYLHRVPEASFYATVNEQTMYAAGITLIVAFFSIVAMIAFSHFILGRPLTHLVEVARAIANGDLRRRITMKRRDEVGVLAENFNTMADSLQTRITKEQEAQHEAKRLQQIEAENRETLEKAVASYLEFVQHVASGNLNQQLTVRQNGTLGLLGDGLNGMVNSLRSIANNVQEASNSVAAASAEILSATTQQASSTAEQSSAITQATTTVEEVKKIAQQTAQQAGQVTQESQTTLDMAQRGTRAVENTVKGMGEIRQKVESIAQTILGLSEQTQAIGAITQTVSELADQSNMLALNAAIEAARAGEQGKSFAVVAQQVRELAERSKAATVQVQEILSEIQRATNTAVMVTEEGTKGVEIGVKLSEEAGQIIHQIASEVESGAQANTQMAAAAHQQTIGMDQIGQAMRSIQQATTQTLASTRQAETAAKDLNALAQSLQQTVTIYRL